VIPDASRLLGTTAYSLLSRFGPPSMSGMAIFTGTELDSILRGFDVETVVLAGVSTNIAIPCSACEAIGLGYNVVLAEDCSAGGSAETHAFQVNMHIPFLATVAASADVATAIAAR